MTAASKEDYESLEAALWDWREAFLGSGDVGDDAFGKLIEKAVAHDLTVDRVTSENERLRALLTIGRTILRTTYGSKESFAYVARNWVEQVEAELAHSAETQPSGGSL